MGGGQDAVQQGVDDDTRLAGEGGTDDRVRDGEDQTADQVGDLGDGQSQPVGVVADHRDQGGAQAGVVTPPALLVQPEDVLQAIRSGAGMDVATRDDAARAVVREAFERVGEVERGAAQSLTWETLAARGSAGAGRPPAAPTA